MDMEEVIQRHRKEKKDLQSKIQALKKTAVKGDKKKKKEVQDEILKLENDLDKKHNEELSQMTNGPNPVEEVANVSTVTEKLTNLTTEPPNQEDGLDEVPGLKQHRISKAQKRRDKKMTQSKERELRIIEQEAEALYGGRNVETETIKKILKERGLQIHEIPSDGNCLYCAVDHQLKTHRGANLGVEHLRKKTSTILRQNYKEYLPFLSHPDTGEMFTESQFYDYCDQVMETEVWGGHIELRALSEALQCCIEVIQSEGPSIIIGEHYNKNGEHNLILTYHRKMYSLGEHYNSVEEYVEEVPEF
ncbi:OTU domain-containing protein 6B [Cimex lectularius]|uniref:ubiquitinyl hydrolase 1 n=1 Tax=Cimex lectularius TaxID=79782 RepID=A0A8I6RQZ4_CIMLE|nr:OTU domain-containing protein 6B [Cimex lectularius]